MALSCWIIYIYSKTHMKVFANIPHVFLHPAAVTAVEQDLGTVISHIKGDMK